MNFDSMSWVLVMALSLSVFSLFVFLFSKFIGYMKREQDLNIESFKDSLIDWIFQGVGAIFSVVFFIKNFDILNLTISSFLVFLAFGIIPRVRRAFRKQ